MEIDQALQDVQLIKDMLRLARVRASGGAPFFVLWGAVWFVGYLLPWLGVPGAWIGPMWLALDLVGALGSILISLRFYRHRGPLPHLARQWYWSALIFFGFAVGAASLFGTTSSHAAWALFIWPLAIGAWYMLGGIFFESRLFLLLGIWIGVLSVAIPLLPMVLAVQQALMGVFGGGALLASGLSLLHVARHE